MFEDSSESEKIEAAWNLGRQAEWLRRNISSDLPKIFLGAAYLGIDTFIMDMGKHEKGEKYGIGGVINAIHALSMSEIIEIDADLGRLDAIVQKEEWYYAGRVIQIWRASIRKETILLAMRKKTDAPDKATLHLTGGLAVRTTESSTESRQ